MAVQYQPVAATASLTLNKDTHEGNVLIGNAAAGMTVTLPASSGKGDVYKVVVGTTITSNNFIVQVANATDVMMGAVGLTTDIAGTMMPTAATAPVTEIATGSPSNKSEKYIRNALPIARSPRAFVRPYRQESM